MRPDWGGVVVTSICYTTNMTQFQQLERDMRRLASPAKAKSSAWFFKTGPGEYGAGDRFLGLTVPTQRQLVQRYRNLPLLNIAQLLRSPFHEHRLTAVLILVDQYRHAEPQQQARLAAFYLRHRRGVNNWDIVDSSAPYILGAHSLSRSRTVLYRLIRSRSIWDRRIAVLATFWFIRQGDYADALRLARLSLNDDHDLMQKAVGWMLREIGKKNIRVERDFLDRYAPRMPRTMLRYAIEKFPPSVRQRYLSKR